MRRHPPHHLSPAPVNHPAGQDPEARLSRPKSPQQRSDQGRKPVNSEPDNCSSSSIAVKGLTGGTTDATGAAWDGFFDLYPRDSLHPMLELPACKFFIRQIPFVVRDVRVTQVVHGRYVPKKGSSVGETKAFSHRVEHTVKAGIVVEREIDAGTQEADGGMNISE